MVGFLIRQLFPIKKFKCCISSQNTRQVSRYFLTIGHFKIDSKNNMIKRVKYN